jgi:cysteine desulfurase family protein (TIGR01976 family)
MEPRIDIDEVRGQFPALARVVNGRPAVFLDGPAGSQVPLAVADAVREHLLESNANTHGLFPTSVESDARILEARRAAADLVGAADAAEIVWGPNMTTLTFALSRAVARGWRPGDEVVVTRLDHDANVTPWVRAAEAAGATVRWAGIHADDATLDLGSLREALSPRTRLVAVTAASNATGSLVPIADVARWAHEVGAEVFVDAVHHAPHGRIDVAAWGCDYLACSAYKFFGPHVGILWGRRARMQELAVDKVRPAEDEMPGRFETGTQCHEGIGGVRAAIEYLADLGRRSAPGAPHRRAALDSAYAAIAAHERALVARLLAGLADLPGYRVWGITDPRRLDERAPTVSITHGRIPPAVLAAELAARGVFAWHGNYYALELSRALGREPDGMLRLGLLHYNTPAEVDRCLEALEEIASARR